MRNRLRGSYSSESPQSMSINHFKIEPNWLYDDDDVAVILHLPSGQAVKDKRSRGGLLPESVKIGRRRLTRGRSIIKYMDKAELLGRIGQNQKPGNNKRNKRREV